MPLADAFDATRDAGLYATLPLDGRMRPHLVLVAGG